MLKERPTSDILDEYQKFQYQHDLFYHADIISKGTLGRMDHIFKHFAKYFSTLVLTKDHKDNSENKRVLIDSFIMASSACNLLNIRISACLEDVDYCQYNGDSFIQEYARYFLCIAKACDSADHQEDFPIRLEWELNIINILKLVYVESYGRKIDIISSSMTRLKEVEAKNQNSFIYEDLKWG